MWWPRNQGSPPCWNSILVHELTCGLKLPLCLSFSICRVGIIILTTSNTDDMLCLYELFFLSFLVQASLPSLQAELEHISGGTSPLRKVEEESVAPSSKEKYPLRMPEGLQWILLPLASRLCHKVWRRQRSAMAKPLHVRPGVSLQPAAVRSYPKLAAKQSQPEVPPSKAVARVPRLIQPAPTAASLPQVQHLSLQPALGNGRGFELQGILSAQPPATRPCLAATVPPNLVSSVPIAFQPQMMLPVLPSPKVRKPNSPRPYQKKRGLKPDPLLKAAPLMHPTPVIFTVPASAMKVVGIANGCNVLQSLAAAPGRAAQPIPITTLLVNPAPFPCSLSQPITNPPTSPLVVSSGSAVSPTPPALQDTTSQAAHGWTTSNKTMCVPVTEDKMEAQEPPLCTVISKEGGRDPQLPDPDCGVTSEAPVQAPAEERVALLSTNSSFSPMSGLDEAVKVGFEESPDAAREPALDLEKPSSVGTPVEEELVLELGQELQVEPAPECVNKQKDVGGKPSTRETEERGHGTSGLPPEGTASGEERSSGFPKNVSSSPACEVESYSPLAKLEDPSSTAAGHTPGIPVGHEAAGEKEGQEEEEEEDFDDLTQDEEDEMSSASEESVLSVPELQVRFGGFPPAPPLEQ